MASEDPEVGGNGGGGGEASLPPLPDPSVSSSARPMSNNPGETKKKVLLGVCALTVVTGIILGIAIPVSRRNAAIAAAEKNQGTEGTETTQSRPTGNTNAISGNRFNAQLQSFGSYVMDPYDSCTKLLDDIEIALQVMADDTIDDNLDTDCRWWGPSYGDEQEEAGAFATTSMAGGGVAAEAATFDTASASDGGGNGGGESSYETNNQVEGVDEADIVKSDGKYIFLAYGTELVMMDVDNGQVLDRITIPDPVLEEEEEAVEEEASEIENGENVVEDIGASVAFGLGGPAIDIMPIGFDSEPKRTVKSLLLDKKTQTLTAITHYEVYSGGWGKPRQAVSGGTTTAFLYKFDTTKFVANGSIDIMGRYSSARSMTSNSQIHILTNSYVDTYGFTGPLYRCTTEYKDLTKDEYQAKAFAKAKKMSRDYAKSILEGLGLKEGGSEAQCSAIVQVNAMTDKDEDDNDATNVKKSRRLDVTQGMGVLNAFTQVTSFDVSIGALAALDSNVNKAGAFIPTGNPETYANEDTIILAGRGYRRLPTQDDHYSWEEYTFLMGFDVDTTSNKVTQSAVGEVKGYLLNQFSMDYHRGELRVATTNSAKWAPVEDEETGVSSWQRVLESSSQITKLRFVGGKMEQVGVLSDLGVTERIFACRFMGPKAYLVTFQLKDPLYVIDMEPSTPKVLGELKITGFSNYLHPITDDNDEDYLLAVGQEADEDEGGRQTGMKISVFDVSDPSDPREVQKYVIDDENNGSSSSSAQYDHHAFRYLDESRKLILPVRTYTWKSPDNFDGFVVYDVDVEAPEQGGITPVGNVTHAESEDINFATERFCYSQANLPARSMVFNGRLMTFKGHSVKLSGGLVAGGDAGEGEGGEKELDEVWTLDLDKDRDPDNEQCYDYFGPFF